MNDGKKFDHIKTCTLTGTFTIFITARVDLGISLSRFVLECAKRHNHHVLEVLKVNHRPKQRYIYDFIKVSRGIILKKIKIVGHKFNQKIELFYNF